MTLAQGILLAIIGGGLWYWSKDWASEDKGMLVLWVLAMGGIIYIVGPEMFRSDFHKATKKRGHIFERATNKCVGMVPS